MNTISAIPPITFSGHKVHAPKVQHKYPITITNFHRVDDTLMRGAKPTKDQLKELKDNGVRTIISFCTNYNPTNPQPQKMPDEAEWAKQLGMKFHWLPFRSKDNPSEDYVNSFFSIINDAKAKGEKVFIHCRHGADRTGLFAALYRLQYQNVRLSDVVTELMEYGHDATDNPNIIPYIIKFKEDQSIEKKIVKFVRNIIG